MNKFINGRIITVASFLLAALLVCIPAAPASAQEGGTSAPRDAEQNAVGRGDGLAGILNLTPEQLAKIRMIREQNREERRSAGERLRNAQRALDEAIYSNNASEAVIEERARELAAAQAASVRIRALTELSIRRILTPEQLDKMRSLRQRQTRQRRLERELNLQRRMRNRQPGNHDGQPFFPRERLRRREGAPLQQNNSSRPAASQRQRRGEVLRRVRP